MEKTRLRIRFTKTGDLKWISHRDLARVWERLLRRADLQLAFSEGFHPKPRISFPSALALGVEALDEIVELEIVGELDIEKIEADIRRECPAGMELLSLHSPNYGLGKAKVVSTTYRIEIPLEIRETVKSNIEQVLEQETLEFQREKRTVACSVSDPNFELKLENPFLVFSIPNNPDGAVKATELLDLIGVGHLLEAGENLQRIHVHIKEPVVGKA